jgi:hypothetical protein
MNIFSCSHCGNTLYFENNRCMACNRKTGFDARQLNMVSLTDQDGSGIFRNSTNQEEALRFCDNHTVAGCNWLVDAENQDRFCIACQLNNTIPNLSIPENIGRWQHLENAKKRLIYSLLKLRLSFKPNARYHDPGLRFEFLSEELAGQPITTGHLNGMITINVEEADEIRRHITQLEMGEQYRTVLGHFRHESGHYYWNRLVRDGGHLSAFRNLFGNEEDDYNIALDAYYSSGAPHDWQEHYISRYASAHPWEDWAETWANYLHIMDSLETAWAFGLQLQPGKAPLSTVSTNLSEDPYLLKDFRRLLNAWLPLSLAINNLNRSMGHKDFYAFYISEKVAEKLSFIHNLCRLWSRQFLA